MKSTQLSQFSYSQAILEHMSVIQIQHSSDDFNCMLLGRA